LWNSLSGSFVTLGSISAFAGFSMMLAGADDDKSSMLETGGIIFGASLAATIPFCCTLYACIARRRENRLFFN